MAPPHRPRRDRLSFKERKTFARLRGWIECGASLSVALNLAGVSESQFAHLVDQLHNGRNSNFKLGMEELLSVPWHWQTGAGSRPQFYELDSRTQPLQIAWLA